MIARILLLTLAISLVSCGTLPEPVSMPIHVDSLVVDSGRVDTEFQATAQVRGHLSNGAAILMEPRQWRKGYRLFIELSEKTPKDVVGTTALVPVERSIPINLNGLPPGVYIINVNGVEEHLEIRDFDLRQIGDDEVFL